MLDDDMGSQASVSSVQPKECRNVHMSRARPVRFPALYDCRMELLSADLLGVKSQKCCKIAIRIQLSHWMQLSSLESQNFAIITLLLLKEI